MDTILFAAIGHIVAAFKDQGGPRFVVALPEIDWSRLNGR
jgi:hypothetical protein